MSHTRQSLILDVKPKEIRRDIVEKLEFRPTKVLLVFWIIGVAFACIPVGGITTAACLETQISPAKAFAMGYLIPLILLTTYALLFFHTIRYELDDRYIT